MRFTAKVVIVAGGASGTGLAIAKRLAAGGARLVRADINQAALDAAVPQVQAAGAPGGCSVVSLPSVNHQPRRAARGTFLLR